MKYTRTMKAAGEQAMMKASSKALAFYDETDPIGVYEYEDEEGNIRYGYDGCCGAVEGLTFDELEKEFEALFDAVNE